MPVTATLGSNAVVLSFTSGNLTSHINVSFDSISGNDSSIGANINSISSETGESVGEIEAKFSKALTDGGRTDLADQFNDDIQNGLGSGVTSADDDGGYYGGDYGGGGGDYGGGGGGEFGDGGGYYAETDARGHKLGATHRAEVGAPKHETLGHSTVAGLHHVASLAGATVASQAEGHSALDLAFAGHHIIQIGQPAPVVIPVAGAVRLASLQLTQTLAQHAAPSEAGTVTAAHEEHHTALHLAAHS